MRVYWYGICVLMFMELEHLYILVWDMYAHVHKVEAYVCCVRHLCVLVWDMCACVHGAGTSVYACVRCVLMFMELEHPCVLYGTHAHVHVAGTHVCCVHKTRICQE